MQKALDIYKTLTISTAHLSPATARAFANDAYSVPLFFNWGAFGWIVYCHVPAGVWMKEHPELLPIFALAHEHDCEWVRFDCDGDKVEGLRTWDW